LPIIEIKQQVNQKIILHRNYRGTTRKKQIKDLANCLEIPLKLMLVDLFKHKFANQELMVRLRQGLSKDINHLKIHGEDK